MTAPHRLRDLADVLELVRIFGLPSDFAEGLARFVRAKYQEIWKAAQAGEPGRAAGTAGGWRERWDKPSA